MSLIEEKIGFGFALVYPDNRCERCLKVATVARTVSRYGRKETATLATPLHNRAGPGSKITWCRYNFPEIKSSEIRERRKQSV